MKAGRELDALVAEKVMGLPPFADRVLKHLGPHVYQDHGNPTWSTYGKCVVCGRDDNTETCLPAYSTDIAAAWEVVERLHERDMHVTLDCLAQGPQWRCTFSPRLALSDGNYYRAEAPTAPLAICLAALKAMGVEVSKLSDKP